MKTATGTTHDQLSTGVQSSVYIVNANGSTEAKLYDSAGRLSSDLVQNTDGSSSNTLFSAGVKTKMYVTNADGSHDNTLQHHRPDLHHPAASTTMRPAR